MSSNFLFYVIVLITLKFLRCVQTTGLSSSAEYMDSGEYQGEFTLTIDSPTSVHLDCDNISNATIEILIEEIYNWTTEASVVNCPSQFTSMIISGPLGFRELYTLLGQFPNLQTLSFFGGDICDDMEGISADTPVQPLSHLTILNIEMSGLPECRDFWKFLATFIKMPKLKTFSMQNCFISMMNLQFISEIMSESEEIQTFIFSDIVLCRHCQIFKQFSIPSVKDVVLNFSDKIIAGQQCNLALLNAFKAFPSLTKLKSNVQLTKKDFESIAIMNLLTDIHITVKLSTAENYLNIGSLFKFCPGVKTSNIEIIRQGHEVQKPLVIIGFKRFTRKMWDFHLYSTSTNFSLRESYDWCKISNRINYSTFSCVK